MRNPVACVSCRASKRQCIHNDRPPCKRCKDRNEPCFFPPPGTSSLHRQSKRRQAVIVQQPPSSTSSSDPAITPLAHSISHLWPTPATPNPTSNLSPLSLITDEVKNSYLRCSYKWSFHHVPTLLRHLRPSANLTPSSSPSAPTTTLTPATLPSPTPPSALTTGTLWAILALAIRFSNGAPAGFATPIEASNAFAERARHAVLPGVERPTLQGIQALLMITGHSWGAGEGRRAWIYLGMAVRMAQVLGLFDEQPVGEGAGASAGDMEDDGERGGAAVAAAGAGAGAGAAGGGHGAASWGGMTPEEFIAAEERRRTAWTCFLIDSLLSGGKGRRRSLSSADMRIQLPCSTDNFHFGEPVVVEYLDGSLPRPTAHSPPVGQLGIIAHSMRVADIWGRVARWACEEGEEGPWVGGSDFASLIADLERWKGDLPPRLGYSVRALHAHSAANQGQGYAYMHSIYFMAIMFLRRRYLAPGDVGGGAASAGGSWGTERGREQAWETSRNKAWRDWMVSSRRELLSVADQACEMFEEMREFGIFFLRGLVPWVGFTVYTAVGIMLYYYHFPDAEDDRRIVRSMRDRVTNGVGFLKDMRGSWPMADSWRETIKRMQIFYSNIKTKGENSVSPSERTEMRNAIVDYGALQRDRAFNESSSHDSPTSMTIHPPSSPTPPCDPALHASPDAQTSQQIHPQTGATPAEEAALHQAGTTTTPTFHAPDQQHQQQHRQEFVEPFLPADFDMFDADFTVSDAEMEAVLSSATQDFWANFPGEVCMY